MSKEYCKALGELATILCPSCGSEKHTFKRPNVFKGLVVLECTCSNCKIDYSINYKAYEVIYNNGNNSVTVSLR